jgi:hypothetical protein
MFLAHCPDRSGLNRANFLWQMEHPLVKVTEESHDASQEAKCMAMEAMSQGI